MEANVPISKTPVFSNHLADKNYQRYFPIGPAEKSFSKAVNLSRNSFTDNIAKVIQIYEFNQYTELIIHIYRPHTKSIFLGTLGLP